MLRTTLPSSTLLCHLVLCAQPHSPQYYWKLDASSGTIAIEAMNGADGQLQNNCSWYPQGGWHDGALRLNGHDARVLLGPCDLTGGTGDALSLSCWFKPDIVSATERMLLCKSAGPSTSDMVWSLSLVNATALRFRVRAAGVLHELTTPPASLFAGAWYHVAAVYDGTEVTVHLNGSLMASSSAAGIIGHHPQAPAAMGNHATQDQAFFGWMDDVRIYGRALTDQEIIDLVIGTISTGMAPPVAFIADGHLTIRNGTGPMLVRAYDAAGRMVLSPTRVQEGSSVPLEERASGALLVEMEGDQGRHVLRTVTLR